jgi:hypothetical protein
MSNEWKEKEDPTDKMLSPQWICVTCKTVIGPIVDDDANRCKCNDVYLMELWLVAPLNSDSETTKHVGFDFNDDVRWILGRPNFACAGIANALRKSGMNIEHKAEDEQAAAIFWMLEMYKMHGKNWRKAGDEFLRQALA